VKAISRKTRAHATEVCLANCYAGRFYLLCESELSLTFGTHLVAGKRSDWGSALRLGTSERFLGVRPRSTEYRSKGESLINQAPPAPGRGRDSGVANESSGDLRLVATRTYPAFVLPMNHASDGC
jgi:hypothetical protein